MNIPIWYEIIGLIGSLMVALSMTMHHIKTLRILNLVGCLIFGTYGFLIHSLSVTLLNLFTAGANFYFLINLHVEESRPEFFETIFKNPQTDEYIRRFLLFYAKDIKKFFPSFDPDPGTGTLAGTECCFILRQTVPVSLVAYNRGAGGEITVILDYAVPAYRDFKSGNFFFETVASQIASPGTIFAATGQVPAHSAYLRKLGFKEIFEDEQGTHFRKELRI
ncbi:MAG: hypothetical protein FWD78_14075 [Treponema sp.]|nr:hypothetical protein [Treponema sp.]